MPALDVGLRIVRVGDVEAPRGRGHQLHQPHGALSRSRPFLIARLHGIIARTSRASTRCVAESLSMMSPNGTSSVGERGRLGSAARGRRTGGSGYGTSSGANRTISARSHTISPPARSVSTSDSPSSRWSRIDRLPPLVKYSELRPGRTPGRDADRHATRRDERFSTFWIVPEVYRDDSTTAA